MSQEQQARNQAEDLRQSTQVIVENLAPATVLYGGGGPKELPIDPTEYSEVFDKRLAIEWTVTDQRRQAGNDLGDWGFAEGLYTQGDELNRSTPLGEQPLTAQEIQIVRNIDLLLEQTEHRPVIALDFGGGFGLSWMRIATQPKYKTAIEKGELIMLVSNLGSTPDPTPDESGASGIAREMNTTNQFVRQSRAAVSYSDMDIQWAQANQQHIQYLDANALELPDMTVSLIDGTQVPLAGNVDIIHEQFAVTHSHVPDLVLASFGELLSDRGTFYSDTATGYHFLQNRSQVTLENGEAIALDAQYNQQRWIALVIGSKLLQQQGFSYRNDPESGKGIFSRLPDLRS